jgi:formamidopyrimidine-DNA glycosylase
LYFIAATRYGDKFNDVDITKLIPALKQPILDIFFKGKAYFIRLTKDISLHAHFMMDGVWAFEHEKHAHFRFDFGLTPDAIEGISVYYVNQRFGEFHILTSEQELANEVNKLAPGFLGRFLLSQEEWMFRISKFSGRKMLRKALMEQDSLCSGIGNYLLAEILYYAKLHPNITIGELSPEQKTDLYWICGLTIKGHYNGSLEKVIYGKRYCPHGHDIVKIKDGNRHLWYCGVEQVRN